jgi:hypothetical protein
MDPQNEIPIHCSAALVSDSSAITPSSSSCKKDECIELKNIKYKTMIKNGAPMKETKQSRSLVNLEEFLENEKLTKTDQPWCKLDKNVKTKKMTEFATKYATDNSLNEDETKLLLDFLKTCLDRKKLQRVKDVVYDKTTGSIKEIPSLAYAKATKHFTLKNVDKRVSTLKSLAPKKLTLKNKDQASDDSSDSS